MVIQGSSSEGETGRHVLDQVVVSSLQRIDEDDEFDESYSERVAEVDADRCWIDRN